MKWNPQKIEQFVESLFGEYLWVTMIFLISANLLIVGYDMKSDIEAMEDRRKGYKAFMFGFFYWLFLLLPWVAIPADTPHGEIVYDLSFHPFMAIIYVCLITCFTVWLFLFKGAKLLAELGIIWVYNIGFGHRNKRTVVRSTFLVSTIWLAGVSAAVYSLWIKNAFR